MAVEAGGTAVVRAFVGPGLAFLGDGDALAFAEGEAEAEAEGAAGSDADGTTGSDVRARASR